MNFELIKTITILYVEDEVSLQNDIYQNILPFVKDIIMANDGENGLEVYKQNKENIDIVLTDILMPKMNGIEMVDEIRKLDAHIPVIYSTAFSDNDYLKKTIEQSISGYIVKPIDIELLLNAIEKASVRVENERLKLSLEELNHKLQDKIESQNKELVAQNEKLYYQLYTDRLTSLKNRKALLRDIENIKKPVLVVVDIDAFKGINDLYGEHIGNLVIKAVSEILKKLVLYKSCKLYRIGADQFALLKEAEFDIKRCEETISDIILAVNYKPLDIIDYDITIRVNVTVGVSQEKYNTLESADMALKKAKTERLKYVIYTEDCSLDKEYRNDVEWTKIIERAIESNNVVMYFQPIVDSDEKIVKYEALIRIVDGEMIYAPIHFLDIAKKVKFYQDLAKIVIQKSFAKAHELQVNININLSIEDVINVDLIKYIEDELKDKNIAHLITFELLENESIKDYIKVISFIDKMTAMGCRIAIDDFGSGYSNFEYLLKFKPNYLKIDGSLVKNIHTDKNSLLIVKTINQFAHSLGMKTVAEFVHCQEVFDILQELNVDEYQGYYFSPPKKEI
jgi:diguanylate cyclase (GGDEF)-like protein